MSPRSKLDGIARRQLGLVTTAQLRRLGVTPAEQLGMVRRGELVAVRRGVLRMCGAPVGSEQLLLAACLAAGRGAVVSHLSAAALWGLCEPPDLVELTVPVRRSPRLAGIRSHHSRRLGPRDVTVRGRVPVTTVERTLCDVSARWHLDGLERAFRETARRKLLTPESLERCRDRLLHGTGWDRTRGPDLVVAGHTGLAMTDSEAELYWAEVLGRAGLPPERQVRVRVGGRTYRLDLAFSRWLVAAEFEGWIAHGDVGAFHEDRSRSAALASEGWLLVPVTSRSREEAVIGNVRGALLRHGWRPGLPLDGAGRNADDGRRRASGQ